MKTEITEQERQAIKESAHEYFRRGQLGLSHPCSESGFIAGAEFALTELRKPSEDLVQIIEKMFDDCRNEFINYDEMKSSFSSKIAKLLSYRCNQQNDVNVELLEALKNIVMSCDANKIASESEIWMQRIGFAKEAITNAEKQIKL